MQLINGQLNLYNGLNTSGSSVFTGSLGITGSLVVTGSVNITGSLTASLANGYTWVGNGNNVSVLVATSSFAGSSIGGNVSGSSQVSIAGTSDYSSLFGGIASATASLNLFTSSAALRLTNLETTSASVNISLSNLNSFSASENTKTSTLATYTGSIDTKFTAVAASTASLNLFTSSVALRLTNLESTSASVNISVSNINTYTASVSNSIQQLSLKTGSYATTGSNAFIGNQTISGSLTIGSASVATENTLLVGPAPAGGNGEGGQILLAASGGLYTSASMFDTYQNRFRVLRGTNAASDAEFLNINLSTGQLGLNKYTGSGAFPGASTGYLAVDNSGNVITVTPSSTDLTQLNSFSASAALRLTNLETTTASLNISVTNLNSYSASVSNSILNLNAFSASNANTSLNTYTGSISDPKFIQIGASTSSLNAFTSSAALRLTNLETTSASVNISVSNINTYTASVSNSIQQLNTFTSSAALRLTNLETTSASVNISVSNLNTYSASVSNSIQQLNTFTSSANSRLTNLETTSASVNISVSNLNTYSASVSNSIQQLSTFTASNANTSLNTYTGSVSDPKFIQIGASTASLNQFTSSINGWSGSIATTGSNSFNGNQRITGSLSISQNITSSYATLTNGIAIGQLSVPTLSSAVTSSAIGGTIPAGTYYYKVTALDIYGKETTASNEVSTTVTGSTSTITISWAAIAGTPSLSSAYRVYRSTTSNIYGSYVSVNGINTTNFTDTNQAVTSGSISSVNNTSYGFLDASQLRTNNITLVNGGIGQVASLTFEKSTDGASINVVEYASDQTMYEFKATDNPDTTTDFFHWYSGDWQNPSSGWKPLKFAGFTNQFIAQNTNFWSSFNLPSNTPYYTTNADTLANAAIKADVYTSTTYSLVKDNSAGGTGTLNVDVSGFTGTTNRIYWVTIASPTTFNWGTGNANGTNIGTGVTITGAFQTLDNGVQIKLSASGQVAGDRWAFRAFPTPKFVIGKSTTGNAPFDLLGNGLITGSLGITGSLVVTGSITATSFTGSLFGTASYALNGSSNAFLYQTASAASVWTFNHYLQTRYPIIQIYDNTDSVIIPQSITAVDNNTTTITFSSPRTGTAVASKGGYVGSVVTSATTATSATSASVATTASYAISASAAATTFSIGAATETYGSYINTIQGANTIISTPTGSYSGAFYKYVATSGSNARAGEVMAIWNNTTTQFTDVTTNDIGSTTMVTSSVSLSAGSAVLSFTTNTNGWNIKTFVTYL
jgi:hypothetical protein